MSIKQRLLAGYSIIELMIGLGLGSLLLAGAILAFSSFSKSSHDLLAANRLDHELRTALALMTEDIRRAGYSATASNDISAGTNTNPFMATGTDINAPVSSCILFTYDKNSNGTLPSINTAPSDKRFGYRLSGNAVQVRPEYDSAFACDSGTWDNLTDPNLIQITGLNFTITPTVVTLDNGAGTLTIRNVSISITGQLTRDNTVTRTLNETVRVRNDKYAS